MFNFAKRCPIQLKDVWFKRYGNKRWGRGNDFAKQEVMSLRTQTARKFDAWKQNGVCCNCNLASRHTKVFHGNWAHDYESTAATKRHGFLVRFFRPLCSQTGRIRRNFNCSNCEKFEESYTQEINRLLTFYLQGPRSSGLTKDVWRKFFIWARRGGAGACLWISIQFP